MSDSPVDPVEIAPGLRRALEESIALLPTLDARERADLRDLLLLRIRCTFRIGASRGMGAAERERLDALVARAGLPPLDWG